ncbi:MAG: hypothetical protein M1151_01095 [Candidatus Thermoplasmatota archaeon]|jgi:putative sterol carrier protein|nr:hypothetical protein [Candidatus Thermoplasmatota archaeon]MCL5785250.1 hypothetical protein [Candidatus Thermoplasmatota archaeon]
MVPVVLFSREWFNEFENALNTSPEYQRTAETWEGDIILAMRGDGKSSVMKLGSSLYVFLGLSHGKCTGISVSDAIPERQHEYLLEGNASVWEAIISGKGDLVNSVLKGEVKVAGSIPKLMKYLPAAQALIASARSVRTL